MTWQIVLAVEVVLASISTLLMRKFLRGQNNDPWAFAVLYQFLMGLLVGGYAVVSKQLIFPAISLWLNLAIMVVLAGLSYVFTFKALAQIEASEFVVILSSRVLFTLLASSLLIAEGLNVRQLVGLLLVLASVILVSIRGFKIKFGKGEMMALLGAAAIGLANTNDRIILKQFPLTTYLFLATMLPALFLVAINLKSLGKMKMFFEKETFLALLGMSVIQVGVIALFLLALQLGNNSSQVAAINNVSIVLTVLLAIVFLGERGDLARKLLGAGLSFMGLLLLG